jgi:hypothetical protein
MMIRKISTIIIGDIILPRNNRIMMLYDTQVYPPTKENERREEKNGSSIDIL